MTSFLLFLVNIKKKYFSCLPDWNYYVDYVKGTQKLWQVAMGFFFSRNDIIWTS